MPSRHAYDVLQLWGAGEKRDWYGLLRHHFGWTQARSRREVRAALRAYKHYPRTSEDFRRLRQLYTPQGQGLEEELS